jgi:hypothetical protein
MLSPDSEHLRQREARAGHAQKCQKAQNSETREALLGARYAAGRKHTIYQL